MNPSSSNYSLPGQDILQIRLNEEKIDVFIDKDKQGVIKVEGKTFIVKAENKEKNSVFSSNKELTIQRVTQIAYIIFVENKGNFNQTNPKQNFTIKQKGIKALNEKGTKELNAAAKLPSNFPLSDTEKITVSQKNNNTTFQFLTTQKSLNSYLEKTNQVINNLVIDACSASPTERQEKIAEIKSQINEVIKKAPSLKSSEKISKLSEYLDNLEKYHIQTLKEIPIQEEAPSEKIKYILEEIKSSENTFFEELDKLQTAKDLFSKRDPKNLEGKLSESEIKLLEEFFDLSSNIKNLSEQLLKQLEVEGNNVQGLAKIFLQTDFSPFTESAKQLDKITEIKNKDFREYGKKLLPAYKKVDDPYSRVGISLVQRTTRYLLLLKELSKNLEENSPAKISVQAAISKMEAINWQINEENR